MKYTRLSSLIVFGAVVAFSTGACKSRKMDIKNGAIVTNNGAQVSSPSSESTVTTTDRGLMMTFNSDVLFPTNSSYLSEKAKSVLGDFVSLAKEHPNANIQVDGHTDATGEEAYNQWLSEKRAVSVKNYLVSLGLAESRIFTEGYGLSKPVATNKTPEGRQQNRRVEITVLNK